MNEPDEDHEAPRSQRLAYESTDGLSGSWTGGVALPLPGGCGGAPRGIEGTVGDQG